MHGINTSSHSVVCGGTKYLPLLPLNLLQSMASNHSVLPQITVAICCCKNPLNFNVLCLVIPPPPAVAEHEYRYRLFLFNFDFCATFCSCILK